MSGKPLPLFSRPDSKITFNPSRIHLALSASSNPSMPGMFMSVIRTSRHGDIQHQRLVIDDKD